MTEALLAQTRAHDVLETVETQTFDEQEPIVRYSLTDFAVNFLKKFVDDDFTGLTVTFEDMDQLAAGILRLRGPLQRREAPRDYAAILTTLLSPEGSAQLIADEVMNGTSRQNVYNALRSVSHRCQMANPAGMTIERLMKLGDPEYQPNIARHTAREMGGVASISMVLDFPHEALVQRTEDDYDTDNPLAWQVDALCAQTDPEAFFPEKGGSTRGAKRICNDCEVRNICLNYALQNDERFGIWGGLSERERRKLRGPKRNVA